MRSYVERTEDLFVLPDMPARVLRRVEKRLPLADWEELLAIVDMTALGDGRAFMAFTTGGLHIKELLSDKPPFAVPECRNNGVFALTEHGLVGLDANEGTTLKKSWQDVRDHQHSLAVTAGETLEVGRCAFDLSSVELDEELLRELIHFVALRVRRT